MNWLRRSVPIVIRLPVFLYALLVLVLAVEGLVEPGYGHSDGPPPTRLEALPGSLAIIAVAVAMLGSCFSISRLAAGLAFVVVAPFLAWCLGVDWVGYDLFTDQETRHRLDLEIQVRWFRRPVIFAVAID